MNRSVLNLVLTAIVALTLPGCPRHANPGATKSPAAGEAHHDEGHGHEEGGHDEVNFDAAAQREAGVSLVTVVPRKLATWLVTTGEVAANTDREAHVTTRASGRVIHIARTLGDRVRVGEALATIESSELGTAQAAYLEVQAQHELAESTLARQRQLFRGDLTARKEVQAAEHALRLASIGLEKTRNHLLLFGLRPARIARLETTRTIDPTLPLVSPIAGVIVSRHLTLGEMLEPTGAEPAYTVFDTRELWVNANLYERDLARVSEGQPATVTTLAYPGQRYVGRVSWISAALTRDTRTAQARVVVANGDRRLKPEMFATVRIELGTIQHLAIPVVALLQERQARFVFVRPNLKDTRFVRRDVQVGEATEGFYPVYAGLVAGEQVVAQGSFTLKAELLKDTFGEHE